MDTFSKLSSMLLGALETREPTIDLLDSFIDHWKSITNYYIQTTDDSRPVTQTDIPWRLRQMLDILVYEEKQQAVEDMGPCLEYLLQHKLLETLCTLGKAQYPPGMSQQVLLFFFKLLSQIQKPLLQLTSVYRPVQKLIRLCALPGSHTEKEEAQFLLAVSSRVKQGPHTLRYVLELTDQPPASSQSQHRTQASNHHSQSESCVSGPVQSGSCVSCPVQSESCVSGPVQSGSCVSGPVQSGSCVSGPVQSGSCVSSPVQSESCVSGPVQPGSCVSCPVQSESCVSGPVQSGSCVSGPVQSGSRVSSPVQSESRVSGPVQSGSCVSGPVQSGSCVSGSVQSEPRVSSPIQSESGLLWALLQLTRSQRPSVSQKACESLLLLSGVLDGSSGELLSAGVRLAELLAGRLEELHHLLLLEGLDAADLRSWPCSSWRSESKPGHVIGFFTWFDFLDHLTREAPQVLALQLSQCVRQLWLVDALHPQLLDTCEQVVLVSTSLLCAAVRLVQSSSLLDQFAHFLLRTPSLMQLLLQRCHHISDQISMASLSLVDELLQKPHQDILDVLVLRFLQSRCYLSPPVGGQEDGQPETNENSQDLEEDPFFSDSLSDNPRPPPQSSTEDIVNSFLCLVPVQVRSAHLLQEGGYESYVHDVHTMVGKCQALSLSWDWPQALPAPTCPGEDSDFFEGHLLKVLFDRLGHILEQPYELNLQLTAVLSRLSAFNHPLLDEYLLNPYIHLSHCSRSLFSVLIRLMAELMQRIQHISSISDKLVETRRHLLGLNDHTGLEDLTLFKGVIVLEEFCKELAAIAFVKMLLNHDRLTSVKTDSPGSGLSHLDHDRLTWTKTDSPGSGLSHLDHDSVTWITTD